MNIMHASSIGPITKNCFHMNNVLIIDDHSIFRQGVKKIISDAFEHVQFGEAESSSEALSKVHKQDWDIIITDINMPGRSGLELIREIKTMNPSLPILVLSIYEEEQMALRALRAGANGYLNKGRAANDLVAAIHKVIEGKKFISEKVAEMLVCEYQNENSNDCIKKLSDREFFVLKRLGDGDTVTEIARNLSLSVKTISTYRSHILIKLGLKNTAQLMTFVRDKYIL